MIDHRFNFSASSSYSRICCASTECRPFGLPEYLENSRLCSRSSFSLASYFRSDVMSCSAGLANSSQPFLRALSFEPHPTPLIQLSYNLEIRCYIANDRVPLCIRFSSVPVNQLSVEHWLTLTERHAESYYKPNALVFI